MTDLKETKYYRYASDVLTGEQVACYWVRLACQRFMQDLEDERFEFRQTEVERAIAFCSLFRHYEGATAGKQFELEPFQQFIVANLVGLYKRGSDRRKYTQCYIQVARKNGKSFLISVLALYFLIADGESAPQIYVGANARHQASLLFRMSQILCHQIDKREKVLKAYRSEIRCSANNGYMRTISADASKQDGSNPSVAIIDEFHEAPTDELLNVLRSGQQARLRPLTVIITTAGFDKNKPCFAMMKHCEKVLSGELVEDTLFSMIFTLDEGDNYEDERNWVKANPCLGISVRKEALEERVVEAKGLATKYVDVLTKNFDVWTDSATNWLSSVYVEKAIEHIDYSLYRDGMTYIGVDLASTQDLTAISYMTIIDEKFFFRTEYFLPRECLQKPQNQALYRQWYEQGYLHVTDGNVTDYDYIQHHIESQDMSIAMIAYDNYNATQFAINCSSAGLPMAPYSQSIGNFNRPTKFFEMCMLSGKIVINDNPIDQFCIRNVNIKMDGNGNTKPFKEQHSPQKIDGVIAMLMAMGGYLASPQGGGII